VVLAAGLKFLAIFGSLVVALRDAMVAAWEIPYTLVALLCLWRV
jgi:hypothetical protein